MSISDCSAGLCSSDLTRTGELDSVIIADLSFVRPFPILYHSFIKEWLSGDKRMLLKDKVAVISGAAGVRGIGYATAKLFASQGAKVVILDLDARSEEHTSELQSLMRNSYAVFCLKNKKYYNTIAFD